MSRYTVAKSQYRGALVIIDKRMGVWRLVDKASRVVLDYGFIRKTGWSFYLNAGRN